MKKLYLGLILASFLGLAVIPSISPASAVVSASVDIQRYGARNLTRGESVYSQNATALEGDELEFSVNVRNVSSNQANGAVLYVYLPIGFPLDSNSVFINGTRTGGNISNGLFLGNIDSNLQKDVVFRTKVNGYFSGYAAIQGLVTGDNFNSSTKYVSVTKNGSHPDNTINNYSPTYTPAPTPAPIPQSNLLGISLMGKNLTKPDTGWQKNIKAEPGDLIQFSIMLTANSSTAVRNIYLKDTLDSFLDFVSGSVKINDSVASDSLISGQLLAGDLTVSAVKFIKFQAQVRNAPQFGKDPIVLSNMVQVWAENFPLISDSASLSVAVKQPAATLAPVAKTTISKNAAIAAKTPLVIPKEDPKKTGQSNFLTGVIGFGSLWLLIILILIALIIFLTISLDREKKKNKELMANQPR